MNQSKDRIIAHLEAVRALLRSRIYRLSGEVRTIDYTLGKGANNPAREERLQYKKALDVIESLLDELDPEE